MSDTLPAWRSEIHGILPDRGAPRVLMLPSAAGWALPHWSLDTRVSRYRAREAIEAMRLALGIDVTILRYASYSASKERRRTDGVCVLESHDPGWELPPGAAWIDAEALARLPMAHPDQRSLIDAHLAEARTGQLPALRPPWQRAGWFDEASRWTRSELEQLGLGPIAPVEQLKNAGISCILLARTASGDAYFKVATDLPLFANEPRLMRGLSALYPEHVPEPLSVDEHRRWMLLRDFGPAIGRGASVEAHQEVLRELGEIQLDSAARVDELLAMGCLDRRLARLAEQVDPLLADDVALVGRLDAAEIERLRSLGPELKARCAALAGYAVPQTLVHGDLHLENVARPGGSFLFFDWTDACIAHPFLDAISIFELDDPDTRTRLRDGYLGLWTGYEPMGRLLEAWKLAAPLVALHQAVSYQHIIAALEDAAKPEVSSGVSYWLRKLLHKVE